jgi:Ni/Co efflux regulator RcnB
MRMSKIITAALAVTLIGASAAVAQPARRDNAPGLRIERQLDRQEFRQERRTDRQDLRQERRADRRGFRQDRRANRREFRRERRQDWREFRQGRNVYRYDRNEFYRFNRGQRFYFNPHRHFVVNDWYGYRLHRPPYGYHWVRNGNTGDFLLVAITTGIILDLMLNSYYY